MYDLLIEKKFTHQAKHFFIMFQKVIILKTQTSKSSPLFFEMSPNIFWGYTTHYPFGFLLIRVDRKKSLRSSLGTEFKKNSIVLSSIFFISKQLIKLTIKRRCLGRQR